MSQYKVIVPIQGGNILQFKGNAPCNLFLAVLLHIPIQGHKVKYKVKIFCNSRLLLYWLLAVLCQSQYKVINFIKR